MKRPRVDEPVDLSSDDSSSSDTDKSKHSNGGRIDKPVKEIVCEDTLIRWAKTYQEYMKEIPIPKPCGSLIPFTSWTGLAKSIKQLYGQPLHYLTNVHIKQWDQMRFGANDEETPLDSIVHPRNAEATIWLVEEVHRLTSCHLLLSKLWLADPTHYALIDPFFPPLSK